MLIISMFAGCTFAPTATPEVIPSPVVTETPMPTATPVEQGYTYINQAGGWQITFPSSWNGWYKIRNNDDPESDNSIGVDFIGKSELAKDGLCIFTIEEETDLYDGLADLGTINGIKYCAKESGKIATLYESQPKADDKADIEKRRQMLDEYDALFATFKAVDRTAAMPEPTITPEPKPTPEPMGESVLLVNGITIDEMALMLQEKGVIKDADAFRNACKWDEKYVSMSSMVNNFAYDEMNMGRRYMLEGYLFPDTYEFFKDSSDDDVIKRLLTRFDEMIDPAWELRAEELDFTMDQVIILASIIEREGAVRNFAKISAVFHNRINHDMRLDSNATVNYAVHSKNLVLTQDQLNVDSPYNTRRYKGFPLGPICNPSGAAINAALYPDEDIISEGYLYFTLVEPMIGEIDFFKTQKEYDTARAKVILTLEEYDRQNGSAY